MMRGLAVSVALAALGCVLPGSASAEGWYLMYPPIKAGVKQAEPDLDAPLSAWKQTEAFDSGAACETQRLHWASLATVRDDTESIDALLLRSLGPEAFVRLQRYGLLEQERERERRMAKGAQQHPAFWLNTLCISVADPRLGRPR